MLTANFGWDLDPRPASLITIFIVNDIISNNQLWDGNEFFFVPNHETEMCFFI